MRHSSNSPTPNYAIIIPISPTQFESAEWVSIRDVEKGEMKLWCIDNDILEGDDYRYEFVKCLHDSIHCHVFNFASATHAMLFRLTFGGMSSVRPLGPGDQQQS